MFVDHLLERVRQLGTPLCVGLDPAVEHMPVSFLERLGVAPASGDPAACAEALYEYNVRVLDAVGDLVPVVKPQIAYFEPYGSHGIRALERTIAAARKRNLLVILDAKRGDIGSTSEAYARAYLAGQPARDIEVDSITLSPYLGEDSLAPFFEQALRWGKGVFVCARTSNPGGALLQDQKIGDRFVYEVVADVVGDWTRKSVGASGYSGIGIVVGATVEEQARRLRRRLPRALFLVPGFGAQGGGRGALRACFNEDGLGAVVNASRAIMYPQLFDRSLKGDADDIRHVTRRMVAELNSAIESET